MEPESVAPWPGRTNDSSPRPSEIDVCTVVSEPGVPSLRDLVTRPTGKAVRRAIEARLASSPGSLSVSVIDFRGVRVLDFSCADEVVAKLMLRSLPRRRPVEAFFLFRTVAPMHRHCVAEVLNRHDIAAVCDIGRQRHQLLGRVSSAQRSAWDALERMRGIDPGGPQSILGNGANEVVQELVHRRLVYRRSDGGLSALSALIGQRATQFAQAKRSHGV